MLSLNIFPWFIYPNVPKTVSNRCIITFGCTENLTEKMCAGYWQVTYWKTWNMKTLVPILNNRHRKKMWTRKNVEKTWTWLNFWLKGVGQGCAPWFCAKVIHVSTNAFWWCAGGHYNYKYRIISADCFLTEELVRACFFICYSSMHLPPNTNICTPLTWNGLNFDKNISTQLSFLYFYRHKESSVSLQPQFFFHTKFELSLKFTQRRLVH